MSFPHSFLNLVSFLNLHHGILSLPGETIALGISILKSILKFQTVALTDML